MNYNKTLFVVLIALLAIFVTYYIANQNITKSANSQLESESAKKEIPIDGSLFKILVKESNLQVNTETKTITYSGADFELRPELSTLYNKIGLLNQSQNSVVVYPIFTEAAYSKNGFYDYYKDKCGPSCLTVKIPSEFNGEYSASRAAFNSLRLLGYSYITDVDIDKNPDILKRYTKVILLHSEYVTKTEYNVIINHPKVVYLYPNSLYSEIKTNYDDNTITLVRGHGYPSSEITNGFDWKFDNTKYEYDNTCENWRFYEVDNGIMLNCFPEYVIFKDQSLLQKIKDY